MALFNKSDAQQHAYEIEAEIGKGAYGTVYKARDIKNQGRFVALKEIRILTRSEEGMPMSTIREIAMLQQLEKFEHPNIIRLLDVWTGRLTHQEMKLMLVFEHMAQDLAQYLEKSPSCGLNPDNIKDIMHQILNGVDFLHTNRIIHRDLKPQNILISSQGCVKIADFGLARIYSFHMALTTVVVTLYYRSPEVLLQDSYCSAVDIWSCGAILAELYLRKPLFQGTSEIDQLCKIFNLMGLPPADEWPTSCSLPRSSFKDVPKQPLRNHIPNIDVQAAQLLEKMLIFDQRKRATIVEILRDPWFTEDGDISMSSLSSDSINLNTSDSSVDNMDAGCSSSTIPGTDMKQTVLPSLINNVNGRNALGDCNVPTESSSIITNQNMCFQRLAQGGVHQDSTAGYNNASSSTSVSIPSHNSNKLISQPPTDRTAISSSPVHFTNSQQCLSIATSSTIQDPYRPISGNHFRELYEPSSCSNSQKTTSSQHAIVSTYLQVSACKPSVSSTSCQPKSHQPLNGDGFKEHHFVDSLSNLQEQSKLLMAGVSHTTETFKPLSNTNSFREPATNTATHLRAKQHHMSSMTSQQQQQQPFQRIVPALSHSPKAIDTLTSSVLTNKANPSITSAAMIGVHGHAQSQVNRASPSTTTSNISYDTSLGSNGNYLNVPVINVPAMVSMTEYRSSNGQSTVDCTKQTKDVAAHDLPNLQHADHAVDKKQYADDVSYSRQYCAHILPPGDVDNTGVKKGVKRSRPC